MTGARRPGRPPGRAYDQHEAETAAFALAGLLPRPEGQQRAALPVAEGPAPRRCNPPAALVAAWRTERAGRTLDLEGWQEAAPAPAPPPARPVTVAEITAEWQRAKAGTSRNMAWTVPYNGAAAWIEQLSARGKPYLTLHEIEAEPGDPACQAYLTEGRAYIRDPLTLRTETVDLAGPTAARQLARYRWTYPPELPAPPERRWFSLAGRA